MKSNFKTIIDSNVPVLVDFYADWCNVCKSLTSVLEQVKSHLGDDVKIVKIDVDRNPLLAANYQVTGVPTMLVFKDGIHVWRNSGVLEMNDIVKVIKTIDNVN